MQESFELPYSEPSPSARRMGMAQRKRLFRGAAITFLLLYSIMTLIPFYVLFVRTFVGTKDAGDLHLWIPKQEPIPMTANLTNLSVYLNLDLRQVKADLGVEGYIPPHITLQEFSERYNIPAETVSAYFNRYGPFTGWITLISNPNFWPSVARSVGITLASLLGLTLLSIMTGYGLSGLRRRDQMAVYNLYVLEMVIPAMLVIVPQFVLMQNLQRLIPGSQEPGVARWLVQIATLLLIFIKGGAYTTMVFTSAIGAVPRELEESAQIDGSGRWGYLWHILLPLLRVPIATVIVVMLPDLWNRFLEPYVYLEYPVNTTLLPFIQGFAGKYSTNYQVIFSGVLISMLPLIAVYLIFRRFFIAGVMAGAVKG